MLFREIRDSRTICAEVAEVIARHQAGTLGTRKRSSAARTVIAVRNGGLRNEAGQQSAGAAEE